MLTLSTVLKPISESQILLLQGVLKKTHIKVFLTQGMFLRLKRKDKLILIYPSVNIIMR